MEKIDNYFEIEKVNNEILSVAYDIVCRKLQQMFIFDYELNYIKENYILLAMKQIERKNGECNEISKRTNKQ